MRMKPQHGLGKYEFAVVLVIFGILAHLLLGRLVAVEHETEQLEVGLTIRHINIGLKLAIGEHLMRGEEAKIPALLEKNPLAFLGQKVDGGGTASRWHYDPGRRILTYRPRQPEAFGNREQLAWRYAGDADAQGHASGIRLEPL